MKILNTLKVMIFIYMIKYFKIFTFVQVNIINIYILYILNLNYFIKKTISF